MDIENFLDVIAVHGVSNATTTTYRKRLNHLSGWLYQQNMDIHQMNVMEFQRYCDEHNWSNATRNLVAAVVRQYASAMLEPSNPLCRFRVLPVRPRSKKYLMPDQVKKLMAACSGDAPSERRTKAAICLMVDAGLYPREICSSMVDQIDMEAMAVMISGKSALGETAWFSPFTAECIRDWLDVRPNSQAKNLFVGSHQMTNDHPLTPHTLRLIINEVGQQSGIIVTPMDLRNTYCLMIAENRLRERVYQWTIRRTARKFFDHPLRTAPIDEIRAALPFADW